MKLKRVSDRGPTQSTTTGGGGTGKTKKSDAMIAKFAGGLCFAFHPNDSNMYDTLSLINAHFQSRTTRPLLLYYFH